MVHCFHCFMVHSYTDIQITKLLSLSSKPTFPYYFFVILWLSKYFSFVGCSLLSFASRRHQRDTYIGRGKGLVLLADLSVSSQPQYCTWQQQFVLAAVVSRFFFPTLSEPALLPFFKNTSTNQYWGPAPGGPYEDLIHQHQLESTLFSHSWASAPQAPPATFQVLTLSSSDCSHTRSGSCFP